MPLPPYTHFLFFSCILSILYVLLLMFPSLPSDTGFISTWETRLRARTCLMEPLVPCVCWGIALVPDCEGQWFSLLAQPGFASPVLIYMNSFASPLIWKWDQVLNFIYFSGMLNNNQWLFFFFLRGSRFPDWMLIQPAFHEDLVRKSHLAQLFQNAVCKEGH